MYGLHFSNYLASKLWNSLFDGLRACEDFYEFERKILSLVNFNIKYHKHVFLYVL